MRHGFYICGTGLVRQSPAAGRIIEARTAREALIIAARDWLLDASRPYTIADVGPRARGPITGGIVGLLDALAGLLDALGTRFRRRAPYGYTGETVELRREVRR